MADAALYLNQPEVKKDNDLLCCGCFAVFLLLILIGGMAMFGTFGDNPNENTEGTPRYGQGGLGSGTLKDDCADIPKQAREYIEFINKAAKDFGLDPALIAAVIDKESSWKADSYRFEPRLNEASYGLMQTLISTARGMGYKGSNEGLYDPATSIHYGSKYLAQQIKTFGSVDLALSAYNGGPGIVKKGGGVPAATRAYVAKVKALYQKYAKCLEQINVNTNGINSATQKLLNNINKWKGYQGNCFTANEDLIRLTYGGYNKSTIRANYSASDHFQPVTSDDLQTAARLLNENKIVTWHINGENSGEHWVILLKIEGNNITYLDNVDKQIYTRGTDTIVNSRIKKNAKYLFFGISPNSANERNVRGQYYNVKE